VRKKAGRPASCFAMSGGGAGGAGWSDRLVVTLHACTHTSSVRSNEGEKKRLKIDRSIDRYVELLSCFWLFFVWKTRSVSGPFLNPKRTSKSSLAFFCSFFPYDSIRLRYDPARPAGRPYGHRRAVLIDLDPHLKPRAALFPQIHSLLCVAVCVGRIGACDLSQAPNHPIVRSGASVPHQPFSQAGSREGEG
jgi:hypothetical protein